MHQVALGVCGTSFVPMIPRFFASVESVDAPKRQWAAGDLDAQLSLGLLELLRGLHLHRGSFCLRVRALTERMFF